MVAKFNICHRVHARSNLNTINNTSSILMGTLLESFHNLHDYDQLTWCHHRHASCCYVSTVTSTEGYRVFRLCQCRKCTRKLVKHGQLAVQHSNNSGSKCEPDVGWLVENISDSLCNQPGFLSGYQCCLERRSL